MKLERDFGASEMCREYGITLTEVSRFTGKPMPTLRNWYRTHKNLFMALILGCKELIEDGRKK